MHIEYFNHNCFMERSIIVWDEEGFCAFVDPGAESAEELKNNLSEIGKFLHRIDIQN